MKEYNCLRNTDYVKTDPTNCRKLASIDKKRLGNNNENSKNKINLNKGSNNDDVGADETSDVETANAEGKDEKANKENRSNKASEEYEDSKPGILGEASTLDDLDGADDDTGNDDIEEIKSKEDKSLADEMHKNDRATKEYDAELASNDVEMEGESMVNEKDDENKENEERTTTVYKLIGVDEDSQTDRASQIEKDNSVYQENEAIEKENKEKSQKLLGEQISTNESD
ncbi:myb-like protein X [Pararge aegeria]|uniref:myb-like protein X n=1 Tax=Pararge aegeria TaxID=116150 RepID=UPI0019D2454B|nr:myb-like protein X [Pararge aegeria]